MPNNATIQIKTLTPRQAINRTNENLRLGTKYTSQNIVVLNNNLASTSFSSEKKEQSKDDAEIGKKINALRSSIKTYEKRILKCDDEKKITKMQSKIAEYEKEIKDLKNQKSGNETRGRKKEKQFVEMIFSLTNTPPNSVDKNYIENFNQAIKKYIAKYFGKSSQIVTIATHLDQHSLHAHAILKFPKNITWTDYVLKRTATQVKATNEDIQERKAQPTYDALKLAYTKLAHHFQDFMAKELNTRFNTFKKGVFYTSLSKYKKETEFNSDFKAVEASKIKKSRYADIEERFEPKNDSSSFWDDLSAQIKRTGELLKKTKSLQEQETQGYNNKLNDIPQEPRSTELHPDDEPCSSQSDVAKKKRTMR